MVMSLSSWCCHCHHGDVIVIMVLLLSSWCCYCCYGVVIVIMVMSLSSWCCYCCCGVVICHIGVGVVVTMLSLSHFKYFSAAGRCPEEGPSTVPVPDSFQIAK
jgi:hypothetical protein